ncbi:hypothetical protein AURDEDRAFT_165414 [Auricularia subglabra TFB-10046 SS5]|nr:hypothetical protein AURDEDRAFT_165414 [Auricularia subglabra TFB-10046 SS5]
MQHVRNTLSSAKKTFDEAALAATQPGTNLDKYSDHTGEQAKEWNNRVLSEMEQHERESEAREHDRRGYSDLDSEDYKREHTLNQAYVAEHEMRKERPGPLKSDMGHRVEHSQPRGDTGPGIQRA